MEHVIGLMDECIEDQPKNKINVSLLL